MLFINLTDKIISKIIREYSDTPDAIEISPDTMMFAVRIQQDNFINRPYLNITL